MRRSNLQNRNRNTPNHPCTALRMVRLVGTYLEHKFQAYLQSKYQYTKGSSAKGIDFPELDVDIKVTSIRQPQSSCPFKSARQKISWTLAIRLLVFVYDKQDDPRGADWDVSRPTQHTILSKKNARQISR